MFRHANYPLTNDWHWRIIPPGPWLSDAALKLVACPGLGKIVVGRETPLLMEQPPLMLMPMVVHDKICGVFPFDSSAAQ